jgi:hypothetical protein
MFTSFFCRSNWPPPVTSGPPAAEHLNQFQIPTSQLRLAHINFRIPHSDFSIPNSAFRIPTSNF